MDNLKKTFYEILNNYNSNQYINNKDKLIELEAKCNWLSHKILEIKDSAKMKKLINNREREL